MKRLSAAAVALILTYLPGAQTNPAGRLSAPASPTSLVDLDQIATVELAPLSIEGLRKEDAQRQREGLPPRFAVPTEHDLTPATSGTWENLDADTLLWRLRVRAPGVVSLNLGFERFRMTPGGRMVLHSADDQHVVRPFTAADNERHGELWTPVVLTDDLVIEVAVPAAEAESLQLRLTRINQGYRGFGVPSDDLSRSGSCNADVVCPQGDDWRLEIPSVGVISTGGSTFCTGFLVNNVRQDLRPYFMTANHCGISAGNAPSLVVYWNYENSVCRPPGSPSSGGPGDGSLAQFNTGSIFRAARSNSDFTLVELDDPVDPLFDVSYAGWDATGVATAGAIGIHHPNTDEKRISFEYDPTTTTTYLQEAVPGDGTHVRITDWDLGTTEPGSSGSPLFDPAHRVIGQLHGGFASCTSQTSDWYGKFSVSWTGGGTSSTRLSNWLDPDGTGTLVLDTVSLATLCSDAGTVVFERGRHGCAASATIEVVDCGLNTSGTVAETVVVGVTSDSDPGGESVLLTETGPGTSRFRGSIPLDAMDAPGVLQVTAGDTLVASYLDADDGMGGTNVTVTGMALVDCAPPLVLGVSFTDVGASTATLLVTADEPVDVLAELGTTCGASTHSGSSSGLATSVSVPLTGLFPDTTYFVRIELADEAGNVTSDDNGGLCWSFTTDDVPLFFTEEFLGDTDLSGVSISLRPSAGSDGYTVCRRAISALPTSPTGGANLSLSDDSSAQVTLTGGAQVALYGTLYSSLFVNSNGNLTFGSGDTDYTESLSEHFARPRISAYWDDLNPSAGGTVSRRQLGDRLAITWQGVPEYGTTNQNTFQVELFFSGVIRLSYLSIASTDGIAGISEGLGLDPNFVEVDLSNVQTCGGSPYPRPAAGPTGPVRQAEAQ